ncbi:hypothetical protein POM88_007309 [Heracleum sosnowskyi]|uniref:Uncharacterized protein n=1 Tax=Heracleum sosnowskyi TaxID=360622 RepID=A0AAD8J575_9APIA|nr:hypothetical protein POM88_007309 [Heracleum sosnowskyi]
MYLLWDGQIEMEQNNSAIGCQEASPVGVGGVYKNQGFDVVAVAVAGSAGAAAVHAVAGGAAVDGCAAVGDAGGAGAAVGGDGDVAVGGAVAGGGAGGVAAGAVDGGVICVAVNGDVAVAAGGGGGAGVDGGTTAAAVDGGAVASDAGAAIGVTVGGDGDVAVGSAAAVVVGGGGAAVAAGGSAAGASSQSARGKKRESFRHTQQQVHTMEAYFKEYPYPGESLRNYIARGLGMDPAQVKCWFQNKRSQMKIQGECREKEALRYENDMLRAQKKQIVEALSKNTCAKCRAGSSRPSPKGNKLRLENIHLKGRVDRLKSTLPNYMAAQNLQNFPVTFHGPQNPSTSQNQQYLPTILHNSQNLPVTFQNLRYIPVIFQNPQNHTIIPMQNPRNLPVISQNRQHLPVISRNPQYVPMITEADKANSKPVDDIGLRYARTSTTSSGKGINLTSAVQTSDESRQSLKKLVVSAADELKVMAMATGPLWISSIADGTDSMLNEVEYLAMFPNNFGPTRLGYTWEGSRHIAKVSLNPTQLLSILMNVNEWAATFSAIVWSAITLDVLSEGTDYNAAIQVMAAEYHIPTPLVPNRNAYFARYCTKHSEGVWAVVDISVDNILPTRVIMTCLKKPSGCLIQEMADGTSKITWIEHVHADYNGVSTMYKHLLLSGLGFGAKRWVSILERQCQLRMTAMSANVPSAHGSNNLLLMTSPEGRKGILKFAARLVKYFLFGTTSPKTGRWTRLQGNFGKDVRLMRTRVMDVPGLPNGTLLSVATSFPVLSLAPSVVFNFFNNHRSRKEWDIFATADYEQVFHIPYGEEAGKCVSMYKVPRRRPGHMLDGDMLMLQESWSDPVASHIVFVPTEIGNIDLILRGGNPNVIPLLPSGLTILPDGPSCPDGSSGTLLTVSFQVLMNESPVAGIDLEDASKVAQLLRHSCEKIKHALGAISPNT